MSESKVPLPEPQREDCIAWYLEAKGSAPEPSDALIVFARLVIGNLAQTYADARAAEARRLALDVDKVQAFEANVRADERRKALMEAAKVCYDMAHEPSNCVRGDQLRCYERLRALADEASHKQA